MLFNVKADWSHKAGHQSLRLQQQNHAILAQSSSSAYHALLSCSNKKKVAAKTDLASSMEWEAG